jgi:Bax protein
MTNATEQMNNHRRLWSGPHLALFLIVYLLTLVGCSQKIEPMPDLAAITDVNLMKQTFYDYLTPIARQQNSIIEQQRERVSEWRDTLASGNKLGWLARRRLNTLANTYEIADLEETADIVDELWLRVDIIPVQLTLAQAAIESGWGRSRFAVDHNNLFGQWCYQPGCGVIPKRRPEGMTHEVASFESVSESVRRYMNNLNTHPRYAHLRQLRAQARQAQRPVTAALLTPGLLGYSERGEVYVEEVATMIRRNESLVPKRG